MGVTCTKKIIILSVLVSLITSSLTAMEPLDNKAATNDIDISTTRTTKDQEITAMHETGETSNTPLTRHGSTFHSTAVSGATKTISEFKITKENNTSSQILTSMKAHDQAIIDSTHITDEEDRESASEEMTSLKSSDLPMFKESITEQPTELSSISTISILNEYVSTNQSPPTSSSVIGYTLAIADDNELLSTEKPTISVNTGTTVTNQIQSSLSSSSSTTLSTTPKATVPTTKVTTIPFTTTTTTPITSTTPSTTTPITSTTPITTTTPITSTTPSTTTTPITSTTPSTTTTPITSTTPITATATNKTTTKTTITTTLRTTTPLSTTTTPKTTTTLNTITTPRTTTTRSTTTTTIRPTPLRTPTMSSSKRTTPTHMTSRSTSALETPNQYLNEINHLNSNVSDLEEEVSSLTAAVVVLSLFLVTILILCAVYYIRRRLRPAKSPFDDINMKEIDVEKRENERRGPFFGNTDNIFRVSTATLGENDHTPVPAKTFKPAGNTGYSERTSASITIDGNIEDRSVL
ncbi:uncharacterized protein LOC128161329 [Crassostrea angulata]|uniref:uncharacterized protein LOC128161329 n=1 Tax=Magallana angulata TaxID=2784310 RepID=UPI0022B0BD22|nr:uncharacterized protein LOC128161329 [Crassostrea angulata]